LIQVSSSGLPDELGKIKKAGTELQQQTVEQQKRVRYLEEGRTGIRSGIENSAGSDSKFESSNLKMMPSSVN
jgi:hypothetical protein